MSIENPSPFYTEEEIKENAKKWKEMASKFNYDHDAHRLEGRDEEEFDIAYLHNTSFIDEVIPNLIAKKEKSEKVKILDIGAGSAEYADQIREKFGDALEVVTTGLSKSKVKQYREDSNKNDLNPDDLKLASIFQMSDYPEFDLIIDTFGEQYYVTKQAEEIGAGSNYFVGTGLDSEDKFPQFERFIRAVIAKLKYGGIASLHPVRINHPNVDIDITFQYSTKNGIIPA